MEEEDKEVEEEDGEVDSNNNENREEGGDENEDLRLAWDALRASNKFKDHQM